MIHILQVGTQTLHLLPDKAIYIPDLGCLLVADVHLGKAETFQAFGVPIASQVNQTTLNRLLALCQQVRPQQLLILGDLFHAPQALTAEVLQAWADFLAAIAAQTTLIVGNHDRPLTQALCQLPMTCQTEALRLGSLRLSHEPETAQPADASFCLNICGHTHPVVRLKSRLDSLRLPCFYLDSQQKQLTLPAFGEFTGGYEVPLSRGTAAYVVAENTVVALDPALP
ncbi:MAG: ligase-associated DNA damage response endonuclease PdeM [Leptolyngbya sp. SIO4C1]|nr:ligase-associated DNA damage response endonuclease PdeM [Leptolyngbya sp. SIO4C1]